MRPLITHPTSEAFKSLKKNEIEIPTGTRTLPTPPKTDPPDNIATAIMGRHPTRRLDPSPLRSQGSKVPIPLTPPAIAWWP